MGSSEVKVYKQRCPRCKTLVHSFEERYLNALMTNHYAESHPVTEKK